MTEQQNMNSEKYKRYFSGKSNVNEMKVISNEISADRKFAEKLFFYRKLHRSFEDIRIESDNDLIQRAYKSNLDGKDQKEFDRKHDDDVFRKKVDLYKNLRASLDSNTISKKDSNPNTQVQISYTKLYRVISVAAAIVILFVAGNFYFGTTENTNRPDGLALVSDYIYSVNIDNYNRYKVKSGEEDFVKKTVKPENQIADNIERKQPSESTKSEIEVLIDDYVKQLDDNHDLTLLAYTEIKNTELPENFEENLFMTNLANLNLRDTSSDNIQLNSPENLGVLQNPLTIKLEGNGDEISIIIKNNKKEVVWEKNNITENTIECDYNFAPGTYYCFLKHDKDKPFIRQFFITK